MRGLSEDGTDLATAVKNVSTERNVMNGGRETDDSLCPKCNRSKDSWSRPTNSHGMVRGKKQGDDQNKYYQSPRVTKRLKFNYEEQGNSTQRIGDAEKAYMRHRNQWRSGEVMRKASW